MNLRQIRRHVRLGAALLAGAVAFEGAGAQIGPGGFPEDSGTALNRHLKELADSPRSLSALLGAAKAALDLGDPQAAVTFYARAEEIAPRDGRIKAGIGAAFLAMEQPEPALKFLEEARGLGLPEGVIAADRGLAHDLLGDPAAAQRDYAIAMRANDNDELRRRLALSRAISGDRGGALAAIEDQVRRNSPAGRRVRAFVLALTGDTSGATEATRSVMPAQAAAMQPFFARLPQLRPAERAMAVHFGRFPGDPPPGQMPAPLPNYAALPPNIILGGRPDPKQPALAAREPAASAPATPPATGAQGTRLAARVSTPGRTSPAPGLSAPPAARNPGASQVQAGAGAKPSGPAQGPPNEGARPTAIVARPAPSSARSDASSTATPGISALNLPGFAPGPSIQSAGTATSSGTTGLPAPAAQGRALLPGGAPVASNEPARPGRLAGLAGVAATIRSLDEPGQTPAPQQPPASPPRQLEAPAAAPSVSPASPNLSAPAPSTAAASEARPTQLAKRNEIPSPLAKTSSPAKPASARRIWVQLGGKPDEAALNAEFQRLKARAPGLLGDKAAWTAPAGASNSRLLVGPFKTMDDADLFVGMLNDEGLRATAWTSPAGQEIVKLAAR